MPLQVPLSLDHSDIPVFFLEPREPRKRSMYFKGHSSPTRHRYRFSSTAPRSPYSSRRTNRLVRQLALGKRLINTTSHFRGWIPKDLISLVLVSRNNLTKYMIHIFWGGGLPPLSFSDFYTSFFFLILFILLHGVVLRGKTLITSGYCESLIFILRGFQFL